jgi:serine/threonine protein kinase
MADLTGMTIGPYRIIEQIGRGGMATVYKAYHAAMDRHVAIKILPEEYANDPGFRARFEREAKTVANLRHPHILPVFDYGEKSGISYLVMPYIPTGTLKTYLAQEGQLPLDETARIFIRLAEALDYAHRQGVIHRDIKPDNVLFDEDGNALLTDFGLTRMVEGGGSLTGTGVIGTPAYMSPEQGQGMRLDHRSDIYSLGIILYEMVTGDVPFSADTPIAVIFKHVSDPLPLPLTMRPDLQEAAENVILKALSKDPKDRFDTCVAMAKAFEKSIAGQPVGIEPPPTNQEDEQITAIGIQPTISDSSPDVDTQMLRAGGGKSGIPRWILALIGILVIAIIAVLASGTLSPGDDEDVASETAAAIVATETESPTETRLPTDAPSPTNTDFPTETDTPVPTDTYTPTDTPTATNTPDVAAAAQTVIAQQTSQSIIDNATATAAQLTANAQATEVESVNQTAAATLWTATPTPNFTASVEALMTEWAIDTATQQAINQTATATWWTDTPTPTFTPTNTPTPTDTLTPSNTPTSTLTNTQFPTNIPIPPTPIPTATNTPPPPDYSANNPVTSNNQWTPVTQTFDGVEMVLVPAGCFMMGSTDEQIDYAMTLYENAERSWYENEQPVNEICFDEPFWIDRYEVTNEQHGSTGCTNSSLHANQPRNCISWFDARDYCEGMGGRLPTEAEWEYAARGPDNLIYPWGNDFVADNVVYEGKSRGKTAAVGSKPGGISWVGAYDLSGNLWEWTSTSHYEHSRVLRGGSFYDTEHVLRSASRDFAYPDLGLYGYGFRCARSYAPPEVAIVSTLIETSPPPTLAPTLRPITGEQIDQVSEYLRLEGSGYSRSIESIAISPDGMLVAAGTSLDVYVWEVASGQQHYMFEGEGGFHMAFSPDGTMLATGGYHDLVVWEVARGQILRRIDLLSYGGEDIAFSPDNSMLAFTDTRTVQVIDVSTGQILYMLDSTNWMDEVVWHPDGTTLISSGWGNPVTLWDLVTSEVLREMYDSEAYAVTSLAFSPDGSLLAASTGDGQVWIADVTTGQSTSTLGGEGGEFSLNSIAFSPDGSMLVTGGQDNKVKVWDATTGELLHTLVGHTDDVNSVAFSPSGSYIVSGAADGTVRVWGIPGG